MRIDNRRYPPTNFARVAIDRQRCDGCGKCVQTCPGQLLELQEGVPVDRSAADGGGLGCIGCSNCYAVCDRGAINIRGRYRVESGYYRTRLRSREKPNPLGRAEPPPLDELGAELSDVERVIYQRRSTRLFKKNKPVQEALLRRILEAGRFAPSQGNCQPWSFVVISDRQLLDRIAKACQRLVSPLPWLYLENGRGSRLRTAAVNLLARLSPNNFDQRLAHGINTVVSEKGWEIFLHAPCVILVLGDRRGIGDPIIDCSLAAHNMVLTAHALGLGTCYVGFSKMINQLGGVKNELGIEWPYKVITSIALGHPLGTCDRAVARERPPVAWFPHDRSGPRVEQ